MTLRTNRVPTLVTLAGLALFFAGCVPADQIGVTEGYVAVPGDWDAPARTRAVAATQRVEVVDPPLVSNGGSCTSSVPFVGTCTHTACRSHPGTAPLFAYLRGRWSYVRDGGEYSCRRNSNPDATQYLSVHSVGRAIDVMIPTVPGGDADNTLGDPIANFLIENAEYIGIQRVIWDGWYWNGMHGFSQISDTRNSNGTYRTNHHVNHIHVEMSVAGADMHTRFFTDGAPVMTCPSVCYGTAIVHEDCSTLDCAATRQLCADGPPHCVDPGPPEPMVAAANPSAALAAVHTIAGLTRFNFVTSERLFDTRMGNDSTRLLRSDGSTTGAISATRTGTFTAWTGLPPSASSVWLNVHASPRGTPGFVEAFAAGAPQPAISTVNFDATHARADGAAIALGTGNGVTFTSNTDVDVIADWTGVFATTGLGLRTSGPNRVMDTRGTSVPIMPGVPLVVDVGAPAEATGAVATVAVIAGTADGFLSSWDCAGPMPTTSIIDFVAGTVTANTVIAPVTSGHICFISSQQVDVIVDVSGFLVPNGELSYQAITPARILDTRQADGLYTGRLGIHQAITLPIQAMPGMPADVRAAVVNITTVSPGTRGFVSAYPCGGAEASTSSLNFEPDASTAAVTISPVGGGSLCLFPSDRVHVIVDVLGVWVPTPGAPPATVDPGPTPPDPRDDPSHDIGGIDGMGGDGMDPDAGTIELPDGALIGLGDGGIVTLPDGAIIVVPPATGDGSISTGGDASMTGPHGGSSGCHCRAGVGPASSSRTLLLLLVLGITVRLARRRRTS